MTSPQPLPSVDPEHRFDAPWHAEVFALTVHLNEAGVISWPEWTAHFGRALAAAGTQKDLDGAQDYYLVWLDALAQLLVLKGHADGGTLSRLAEDWASAYRQTPHGKPVCLSGSG